MSTRCGCVEPMICDCCIGIEKLTPLLTANRPGLFALSYRVGTHAAFFETMLARLSNLDLEIPEDSIDEKGKQKFTKISPLLGLKTRSIDDPSIALLDAWAVVADVLTFYQERIANEGYLRTAIERRSVLELARLIGYSLRPGVASSVYLAYTLDEDLLAKPPKPSVVTIPAGARVQSVPEPGELPQTFETSNAFEARSTWNKLKVRLTQPQTKESITGIDAEGNFSHQPRIYLKGISTNLKPNDPLLIDFGSGTPELFQIADVIPDSKEDRTLVKLQDWKTFVAVHSAHFEFSVVAESYQKAVKASGVGNLALIKKISDRITKMEERFGETPSVIKVKDQLQNDVRSFVLEQLPAAKKHDRSAEILPILNNTISGLTNIVKGLPATKFQEAKKEVVSKQQQLYGQLMIKPSIPPFSPTVLPRDLKNTLTMKADPSLQLLNTFQPMLKDTLAVAMANAKVTNDSEIKAYALRVKAAPFGNNAPKRTKFVRATGEVVVIGEWPIIEWELHGDGLTGEHFEHETEKTIYLDASYDKIASESWIAIDQAAWYGVLQKDEKEKEFQVRPTQTQPKVVQVSAVQADISRSDYGISGKTTRIELTKEWITIKPDKDLELKELQPIYDHDFRVIRNTAVYSQSEELELAEEPIETPVCKGATESLELGALYTGLESGRWLIVSGERADVESSGEIVSGIKASELVMLASVEQAVKQITKGEEKINLLGDKTHSFITLAEDLNYCYKRDSVNIYANVVKATNGETRKEVLGSGDGSKPFQQFPLRQPPLTYVSAVTPSGIESTLQVRVNDVLWHEVDNLAFLNPNDRNYITLTDNESKTTVVFGNGKYGARLPTGLENVKAQYRNGIGKAGNVKAEQITLLSTRPLGVKEVTNPIRASGGADKEDRDQARKNMGITVTALDRLVSVQDYADFALTFAGIGKAVSVRLSDSRRRLVHLTIAGLDDIPIEPSSDLFRNLFEALRQFGDPYQAIQIDLRELLALIISANVRLHPDYQWESVEPKIRAKLLDDFGFRKRELGQSVFLGSIVKTIHEVAGVTYVDVDVLSSVSEIELVSPDLLEKKIDELNTKMKPNPYVPVRTAESKAGKVLPAQLAFLTPDVSDTLILKEIK